MGDNAVVPRLPTPLSKLPKYSIMPDIRLVHAPANRLWLWVGLLAAAGFLIWASAFVFGDATNPEEQPRIGANIGFGEDRMPVIPAEPTAFSEIGMLQQRDLGRFVRVRGTVGSRVSPGGVWVRTDDGRRILVRFEPGPAEEALTDIRASGRVDLLGYLQKISRAEFEVWMDSLGVAIPRPRPGRKFGDFPDPAFLRADSLYIKNFYISVRPEQFDAGALDRTEAS